MSELRPLEGHDAVRLALGRATLENTLPGSLLLHGPAGIGKQRLGLWLAQRIVCTAPRETEPCGACQPCRLVLRLEHPDVHWFFPLARPKRVSGPDKLADALEEARAAELEARRAEPLRPTAPAAEPVGFFLAQIQTLRGHAHARPAIGARKVFLIGDAERLVPQEASPEAANALLKILEEPPADAIFILTAADPDALLPTIRSRLLPIRLRPLGEDVVARFLIDQHGAPEAAARSAARLAQGSIGQALGFLPAGDEPGPLETLRRRARDLLAAATTDSEIPRLALAHATPTAGARGLFSDTLDFLRLWLRDLAAAASGAEALVVNHDALDFLTDLVRRLPDAAAAVPDALRSVDEAATLAHGNVNPQLILAWLLHTLHRQLAPRDLAHRPLHR
ncbi:MAG TPA: hypothetical protein VF188_09890 [Longimicrobiales bacterium]